MYGSQGDHLCMQGTAPPQGVFAYQTLKLVVPDADVYSSGWPHDAVWWLLLPELTL